VAVELRGKQIGALRDAMVSAYRSYAQLNMFTLVNLDIPLAEISPQAPLPEAVTALIEWSMSEGKVDALVTAARQDKPGNPRLRALTTEIVLTSSGAPSSALESLVLSNVPTSDAAVWRSEMARLEDSVCRLETPDGRAVGSGFLIGEDLVLTNCHVAAQFQRVATVPPGAARFAMKLASDGSDQQGETIPFAADWLRRSSPIGTLDYAVIALAAPSARPVLPVPAPYTFEPGDIYLILHHPEGAPLKVSAGTFDALSPDGRSISYTVNTEPGSSGSPVFTMGWQHVALHRAGGPQANSGVPLTAISADAAGAWR
jgi:hypothetical protein